MPATGRLAAFLGTKQPYELQEYPVPDPAPGAIVLKMNMANICGSDLHIWRGDIDMKGFGARFPRTVGHEGTGRIHSLGEGVTVDTDGQPLHEGDRVIFQWFYPCHQCPTCLSGHTEACPSSLIDRMSAADEWPHFHGSIAEYHYLYPNRAVFKVPDHLPDDVVAGVNCALTQVIAGLDRANVSLGETVVIQGAGGLGIYGAAVAKARGAAKVIAIDGVDERLALIREFGADEVIDLREFDTPDARVARVKELTDGQGAQVTLEVAGFPTVIEEGIAMTAPAGRYVDIGNINAQWRVEFDPSTVVGRNISFLGVSQYTSTHLKAGLDFVDRMSDRLPFQKVLSHRFPLDRVNEAVLKQDEGHVIRTGVLLNE